MRFFTINAARLSAAAAGLIGFVLMAGAAQADEYRISKMNYKNNGDYSAYLMIRYNNNGSPCGVYSWGTEKTGAKQQMDLTDESFGVYQGDIKNCGGPIPAGKEVWGKVMVVGGRDRSCRKDGTKFIYDPDSITRVVYRSGGTSQNNNRCKISDRN